MSASHRHHYIPQFFIEGFRSKEGVYWVYDKKESKIKRYTSAKQIFFGWDKYTVDTRINPATSVLEDVYYKRIDSDCSAVMSALKSAPLTPELLSPDNLAVLNPFIISLFCRSPKFEALLMELIGRGKATIYNNVGNPIVNSVFKRKYKDNPHTRKVQMLNLIGTLVARNAKNSNCSFLNSEVIDFGEADLFLLGDYPLIYLADPVELGEILNQEIVMPVSSKRLYHTVKKGLDVGGSKAVHLSILTIDQAVRYVCGPDRDFLQQCVEYHRLLKGTGIMTGIRQQLFR